MRHIISAAATGLALLYFVLFRYGPSAFAQSAVAPQNTTNTGATIWVTTTQRIKSKIYENARLSQHPILVVVVHGDASDGSPSTYHYRFAEKSASTISDAVVAAVLRPGYSDGEDTSDGMRGYTTGDNWTPEVVNAVATVLSELKDKYHPRRVILVGHSGGAAIVGNLLGLQGAAPADAALLVSCPCDVTAWRKYMQSIKGGAIWERPVRSRSPLALINSVSASAKLWLLVGSDDQITPSALTLAYAEALRSRKIAVNVTIAPGLGHNILLESIAMEHLKEIASTIDTGR